MSNLDHTIGSHSDDRGGELDARCNCLDQNTPTNTLEDLYKVLNRKFDCTHCGWALQMLDKDFQDINKAVEALIAQAVNKARIEEMEYWGRYLPRFDWDKRVMELETPKQVEEKKKQTDVQRTTWYKNMLKVVETPEERKETRRERHKRLSDHWEDL